MRILEEREKTHGKFEDQAFYSQMLKEAIKTARTRLSFKQNEAIDMILHKVARVCAGDPNKKDHWVDIAGYATLISRELDEQIRIEENEN